VVLGDKAVYGVALNFRGEIERLGEQMHRDPYRQPPVAPVLHIRPRNTWNTDGGPIRLPAGVENLKVAGTLGVVIGRAAFRVAVDEALEFVDGYTIVNDVSIPHESYYRPPIRQRCRDSFCVISPVVAALSALANPNQIEIKIQINGTLRCVSNTKDLVRSVERLIGDVTEFMTLRAGDILLVGEPDDAPLASAGDHVQVEIEGVGTLANSVVPE